VFDTLYNRWDAGSMLLEITLAIIFAKIFGIAFEKIKQPGVIGEIIAGIVLGPCCLGLLSGSSLSLFDTSVFKFTLDLTSPEFKEIAFIGVVFLLFIVGLETNLGDLKKTRKTGISVGVFGIIIPFLIGCGVGQLFHLSVLQSMAIGTIFLATSTTIAIRILSDMDLLSSRVGLTLRTALVVNDVLAMVFFALVFGVGNSFVLLFQISLFFILTILVGFLFVRYSTSRDTKRHAPVIALTIGLGICFLFAAFAENMGLTAIIGAFIAGVFFKKTPQAGTLAEYIKTIGYAFFVPLFFVWVGASFNFLSLFGSNQIQSLLIFCAVFIVFGMLGNFLGSSIGARISGFKRQEAISVGIGMMPVMGVALIIVSTGIDRGIFGDPGGYLANQLRTATLFLIFTSCLVSPILLKRSMGSPLGKRIGKTKTKLSSYHHPHCPECFSALRLDPANNRWFCDNCKRYMEIWRKAPLHSTAKTNRHITYIIGVGTILLCGFVIQSSVGMTVIEKLSALIGIFLGTTLAFFTLKLLFSTQKTLG
jgi:Kef-type K+ transport system membrane component KefB